jgi:hypothetical protein
MRGRILAAVVVVAVLGAGAWWASRREDRAAKGEREGSRLPAFDDRAVTAFTIDTRSGSWRVTRGDGGWRIVTPIDDAASPAAVEALLAAARRTPVVQTVDPADAPALYGLDPPVARLALEGVAASALELGDVAPTGDGIFARIPGRPGVLILKLPEGAPLVALNGQRLRDPALFDLPQSAIEGVDLSPGGVRLSRGDDGWWIEAPRRLPASPNQVDKLLGALLGSKIVGSDDAGTPSDPRFGLGPGALRVTLRSAAGSRQIALGAPAGSGRRYASSQGRGVILIVDAAPFLALPRDVGALRDTKLTNVNRYHVTEVDYASRAKRFTATRLDDARWTTASGATIPAAEVYALLVGLLEAATVDWSAGEPGGRPTATVDYLTDAGVRGRVAFYGDRATWSGAPGATFRLASAPPPVPSR